MRIPRLSSIINRALDDRADAAQAHDADTIRQLDTLIGNLHKGMKMRWAADGSLIVTSANTRGMAYRVTQYSCDCPAFTPCNHMRLYDLLLDLFATDSVTADALGHRG